MSENNPSSCDRFKQDLIGMVGGELPDDDLEPEDFLSAEEPEDEIDENEDE